MGLAPTSLHHAEGKRALDSPLDQNGGATKSLICTCIKLHEAFGARSLFGKTFCPCFAKYSIDASMEILHKRCPKGIDVI